MTIIDNTSQGLRKAWSVTYDCNHSFLVLAAVIKIINYDCKTFIVQAIGFYGGIFLLLKLIVDLLF